MTNDESIAPRAGHPQISDAHSAEAAPTCRRSRGFTLIELMITVAIIGILTAIAIPSYQNYIRKSRRPDAKTALLDLASRQERYFTLNNSFTNGTAVAGSLGYNLPVNLGSGATPDYILSVVTPTTAAGTTYSLQALANGDQVNDTCGTYTLDNFGNQLNIYPVVGGTAAPIAGCW